MIDGSDEEERKRVRANEGGEGGKGREGGRCEMNEGREGPTARFTISGVTLRGAEVRFSLKGKSAFPRSPCTLCSSPLISFLYAATLG